MIRRMNWCLHMAAVGTLTLIMTGGCASHDKALDMTSGQLSRPGQDIMELVTGENMGELTTFVKLLNAADLASTLKTSGPFTVFAPTNDAFDALGKDTLEDLMKPENKGKLRTILMYHIHASSAILSKDITAMNVPTTDAGTSLNVAANGSNIMVNSALVVKPDIVAKNGVVYWIDTVLMPPIN
jgi:uncharacterized surface protein with fasciclin (FAS1) repeats